MAPSYDDAMRRNGEHNKSRMITTSELKINDEFLKILQDNAFNGMDGGDVTDHIAKVLEITEWIKIPNVEKNELRLHVFSKSLSRDAEKCQIALIMRNKPDIDEVDIDDLYNNLRVYEDELKRSSGSNSTSQNLAFLSSKNTNSTNEVSTEAQRDFGGKYWSWVAMLTVRVKKFIQRTRRNMDFKEKRPVSIYKSKIECYNCHRKGHFARECRSRRIQGRRPCGDRAITNKLNLHLMHGEDLILLACLSTIAQTGSAIRPIYLRMDNVRPRASYSLIKRSYYTRPASRPKDLKEDVKTSRIKNMTTAETRAIVNTGEGKMDNALMKSRWVWRPKGNYMDHESKEKGSFILKKFEYGNPESILQDHAVVDSGCSSHMTGNKAYLSDYNGGFVAFGSDPKGGKITGTGKIRTANLDFDDVYFIDELKFNLFSVSQMCDKKNSVLFTDTECLILSPSFKLLDESQVVLRAPRQNGVYSLDLKNIVPSRGITCLYANATTDESKMWHKRLGHVNFKNINKLVKGHLVRGLPSKVFVNDHTCVACKKGKQHKASCKAKLERTIRKPLELLHMDLFGPVSVESINKKKYCLVVTDDFSRFSWVFFLATKDETNEILYKFITGLENQLNHKVKIIRSDHGTEFKNHAMNEFCAKKGIKREFSVARTPQQNGVAERKNRTLIEAARTMLADSLLPIPFWAEAVNTACYVLNRVLVTKPQNKTPYELLIGSSPDWMFDLDFLTNTMNYIPVSVENQVNVDACTQEHYVTGSSENDKEPTQEYILLPLHPHRPRISVEVVVQAAQEKPSENSPKDNDVHDSKDAAEKEEHHTLTEAEQVLKDDLDRMIAQEIAAKAIDYATRQAFKEEKKRVAQATSINKLNTGRPFVSTYNSPLVSTANTSYASAASTPTDANTSGSSFVYLGGQIPIDASTLPNVDLPIDPNMPNLEDDSNVFPNDGIFSGAYDDEDVRSEGGRVAVKGGGGEACVPPQERTQTNITSFKEKSGVEAMQELIAQIKLTEVKQQPDEIFISQDKYVANILKKFDFCSIKIATTPIELNKPLVKDEDGVDVDVHVYRSMIGSLMYLTASRPDIKFMLCTVLEAFSNSDYGGASIDRKSTIGGCQFPSRRLISWQCKMQTIVANSTTEAEYVAAANCCRKVL
ncbi:putative ribonuclease H-like domain-containing protein [Tanacetum coccineum]